MVAGTGDYSGSRLPALTESNFSRLALDARNYTIVMLFLVRNVKYQCSSCPKAESEALAAARSYHRSLAGAPPTHFFVSVDYETCPSGFKVYQFQSVPHVVRRLPSTKSDEGKSFITKGEGDVLAVATDEDTGIGQAAPAGSVLNFAGLSHVPVYRAPEELHSLAVGVAITFALLAAVVTHHPSLFLFPTKSGFWMAVSLSVYAVSVSGVIYCIIRTPAWYSVGRNGEPVLFENSQGQNILEGLLVGAMNLMAAAGVILTYKALTLPRQSYSISLFLVLAGVAIFVVFYLRIVKVYMVRTPWYSMDTLLQKQTSLKALKSEARDLLSHGLIAWRQLLEHWSSS